ncbi:Uncharacterised protein [Candidatus Venteria ishoeyi]|uniref:Uncharacterized protein n=1 Tax=Candidatus Venteria ishoeyi TaxID=1899563 RepID=A0A1H6F5U3_9GAMM|nr:Uncharacterised protein [Candidatus Venteria ishoeyi]
MDEQKNVMQMLIISKIILNFLHENKSAEEIQQYNAKKMLGTEMVQYLYDELIILRAILLVGHKIKLLFGLIAKAEYEVKTSL